MENIIKTLANAVEYERKNIVESSFETDTAYQYAVGHADGLSDALELIGRIERGEDETEVLRKVLDKEY